MKPITYIIKKLHVPGYSEDYLHEVPRGYAYETEEHFIQVCSYDDRFFYKFHAGLTFAERKNGTLVDWVKQRFDAENIEEMRMDVGSSIQGVWRPCLRTINEINQGLMTSDHERLVAQQALRILLEKLDEILLYVELSSESLKTYGHKSRELLILACTELENSWNYYMQLIEKNEARHTTNDYVKLCGVLFLKEYECRMRSVIDLDPIVPFRDWNPASPTASLKWYDAYNKTKHNRTANFAYANLENVLYAIAANVIMYFVRFGPYILDDETNTVNSIINQHFQFRIINVDVKSFYVYMIEIPVLLKNVICYDSRREGHLKPFTVEQFSL